MINIFQRNLFKCALKAVSSSNHEPDYFSKYHSSFGVVKHGSEVCQKHLKSTDAR